MIYKIHIVRLTVALGLGLLLILPLTTLAANLLENGGLDKPYTAIPDRRWRGQDELVAHNWSPFYIADNTHDGDDGAGKLHWMSARQFTDNFGGIDYRLEGDQAQNMWSAYEFEAGIYQQISVTPGEDYGFDMAMVTFWRGPGFPDSDGFMIKQVGIDPTGGSDPTSSNIIWSDGDANDKAWVYLDVAATAQAANLTVFAKIKAPDNKSFNHTDLDMVYFDAAHFDLAPTAELMTTLNGTTVNATWAGTARPGWQLKGYEVQYKDQTAEDWITLQPKSSQETSGQFTGEQGHSYQVRARAWQTMEESYNADIDLPGVWQETVVTIGGVINGVVLDNRLNPIGSALIQARNALTTVQTTSQGGGSFSLMTGPGTFTVTADTASGWQTLEPITTSVTITESTALTLSLRPPNDFIQNGGLEGNFTGWNQDLTGTSPQVGFITAAHRSGSYSLDIFGNGSLSQTSVVSGMYQPILSFWYRHGAGDEAQLMVALFGEAPSQTAQLSRFQSLQPGTVITLTQPTDGWQPVSLPLPMTNTDVYSGQLTVAFKVTQDGPAALPGTHIYLDEISVGSAWGGPNKVYMPVVLR